MGGEQSLPHGNNVYPVCRELEHILSSPTCAGALESVLGPGYCLHRHRALHQSSLQGDQDWHKDSFWGERRMRTHYPRWAMVMYYPQETTMAMGPTAVLPGSQYLTVDHEQDDHRKYRIGEDRLSLQTFWHLHDLGERGEVDNAATDSLNDEAVAAFDPHVKEMFIKVSAGSFVILHYDLFHRGTRLLVEGMPRRYMFKVQFFRTADTEASSFPLLPAPVPTLHKQHPIHDEMHRFLGGTLFGRLPCESLSALLAELQGPLEHTRIAAAYSLGRLARESASTKAMEGLVDALQAGPEFCQRASAFGLIAAGPQAVASLVQVLESAEADAPLRKYACFALGEIREASQPVVAVLRAAVERPQPLTYYEQTLEVAAACVALGLIGQRARFSPLIFDEICTILGCRVLMPPKHADDEGLPAPLPSSKKGQNVKGIFQDATYALTLLCAADPRAVLDRNVWLIDRLSELAEDRNRYIMGYAAQALRCLAEAGSDVALRRLYQALLNTATPQDESTLINARRGLEALDNHGAQMDDSGRARLRRLVDQHICPRTYFGHPYVDS